MSTTWYEVEQSIQDWVKDAWQSGDLTPDTVDDWAVETAESCEYVVYYDHQNDLWANSSEVRHMEDDLFISTDMGIQDRIRTCVFEAILSELARAAYQLIEEEGE